MIQRSARNGMTLHPLKTAVIHFGYNNPRYQYTLSGSTVMEADSVKDLGVLINAKCTPGEHVSKIVNKANSVLGQLRRATVNRSKDMIVSLYKTYVRPLLESSVQAWNPWLRQDIDRIEKVQRRATKLVSGIGSMSYEARLDFCGLTTLEQRRVRGDLIQCFKILNGFDNSESLDLFSFTRDRHDINTRSAAEGLLVPPKTSLEVRKNFFSSRLVNDWNDLPIEVRTATSVNSFKNQYDIYHDTAKNFTT